MSKKNTIVSILRFHSIYTGFNLYYMHLQSDRDRGSSLADVTSTGFVHSRARPIGVKISQFSPVGRLVERCDSILDTISVTNTHTHTQIRRYTDTQIHTQTDPPSLYMEWNGMEYVY